MMMVLRAVVGGLWNCQSAVRKADFITGLASHYTFDFLALTETWISPQNTATPAALSSAYAFSHSPREIGRGGGTGLLLLRRWCFTPLPLSHLTMSSFEFHAVSVTTPINLFIIVIYCPPGHLGDFLEEMDTLLNNFPSDGTPLTVLGDFNLPSYKLQSSCLLPFLNTFSLTFNSCLPTHKGGNVLDLVFTRPTPATDMTATPLPISDHHLNNLHDPNQSGFKAAHSTETALLAVSEKLHAARSAKLSSVLIFLDLSAAFDTVNHKTLLSTLKSLDTTASARISACLSDISLWMRAHQLKLNPSKTELLVIPATARNLEVTMDNELSFFPHVANVAGYCRFLLYNIRRIQPFLSIQAAQLLVQSLVISRLDYWNSLLAGLPLNAIRPLQMIQNAAARLVFNQPKFSHTTPLLRSLYWLPVAARIRFKTVILAYKAKNGPAPSYLSDLITSRTAPHCLRSSSTARLVPPSLRLRDTSQGCSSLAGQAIGCLHTIAVLQAYQADLLRQLDVGNIMGGQIQELRYTADPAMRARKETTKAIGWSIAAQTAGAKLAHPVRNV
ncbi:hypothetical protein C0J50_2356 [Silurus asotus]|uniref:Endonuclease/exonuclease/phosphatase domain-containing protein n=1 Tax=Silurus asotus TaxID=30991 RepID=A0AAD5B8R5_SILAS|nr:hypothetical protein C0J50_2356 [Silurus asotus]